MIKRLAQLPRSKSFFLFGPRQTGKSTLIHELWRERVWGINLLHTDEFLRYAKAPELLRREAAHKISQEGIRTIFVDEIQKVPALLDEVQALIDAHPACQFILTGSSPRKLKRGGANLLGGRALQRFLFPFTHSEIAAGFDLEDTLRFGSLPFLHGQAPADKAELLEAYAETYLREEIQAEGIVRNLGGFSRFLDLAASANGELVNFTAIGREAMLPTRTVQCYYEILEDTLVGLRLEPWRRSLRKRLSAHPKFYLFDTGVTNAINRRLAAPPDPAARGRLFEQWVVLETHRLLKYSRSECRLFFWRTSGGAEADLVIERHGKIAAACEIKSSGRIAGADLTGLASLHEEHPRARLYAVCAAPRPYALGPVRVLPWRDYLDLLPGMLEA